MIIENYDFRDFDISKFGHGIIFSQYWPGGICFAPLPSSLEGRPKLITMVFGVLSDGINTVAARGPEPVK